MAEAFGRDNEATCRLPGRRPHLRDYDPNGCDVEHVTADPARGVELVVPGHALGPVRPAGRPTSWRSLVEDHWAVLEKATSLEIADGFRQIGQLKDFGKYTDDRDLGRRSRRSDERQRCREARPPT